MVLVYVCSTRGNVLSVPSLHCSSKENLEKRTHFPPPSFLRRRICFSIFSASSSVSLYNLICAMRRYWARLAPTSEKRAGSMNSESSLWRAWIEAEGYVDSRDSPAFLLSKPDTSSLFPLVASVFDSGFHPGPNPIHSISLHGPFHSGPIQALKLSSLSAVIPSHLRTEVQSPQPSRSSHFRQYVALESFRRTLKISTWSFSSKEGRVVVLDEDEELRMECRIGVFSTPEASVGTGQKARERCVSVEMWESK